MTEPYYTLCRGLHMWGNWLAFAVAPVVLAVRKGQRRHILYGRIFVGSYGLGLIAGFLLALVRDDPIWGLATDGVVTAFFVGTGYLAPHIARGSRPSYWVDRALTALGALVSVWLLSEGLHEATPDAPLPWNLTFGTLGLTVAALHATWRGLAAPSRWRLDHLTSFMAAYAVSWHFVLLQYQDAVPPAARGLIPVLALPVILWVRRHVRRGLAGTPSPATAASGAI